MFTKLLLLKLPCDIFVFGERSSCSLVCYEEKIKTLCQKVTCKSIFWKQIFVSYIWFYVSFTFLQTKTDTNHTKNKSHAINMQACNKNAKTKQSKNLSKYTWLDCVLSIVSFSFSDASNLLGSLLFFFCLWDWTSHRSLLMVSGQTGDNSICTKTMFT